MKTLLIPTLTLTLALTCLPALAQETAAPKAAPSAADASSGTPQQKEGISSKRTERSANPTPVLVTSLLVLPDTIKLAEPTINEVTHYLNRLLEKMGADPLNVVAEAELGDLRVPSMTLKNVTAIDVLNVITKVSGLRLEAVPSDSGRTVAWVITRPKALSLGGLSLGILGGGMGGGGAGVGAEGASDSGDPAPSSGSASQYGLQSTGAQAQFINPPSTASGFVGSFTKAGSTGAGSSGNVVWVDPAAGVPSQVQVNRVLGIARIYADVASETERADKEAMLVKLLREMTEVQKLKCDVRLYGELHVLVVKGSPEAVELVEQTISALKENVGIKKSEGSVSKFSSGLGN